MRVLTLSFVLLMGTTLTGCLDGNLGVCIGPEDPRKVIRDDGCTKWIIEIDHVSGQAPDSGALNLLEERMESLVRKDSITITIDQKNLQGDSTWTEAELRDLEAGTRDHQTGGSTVTTHVLYVDGELSGKSGVVGFAQGSRYVVMFKENMRDATEDEQILDTRKTTLSEYEQAVLVHEFGHVLGLVANGIDMVHDHEADTCNTGNGERPDESHSENEDSVMFCTVATTSALNFFGDSAPPNAFDADDKADICAAGGKCG